MGAIVSHFFLPVYSRLSWLWRVSSKYLFLLSCHLSTVSIQDCVKIRTIFLERAVVAKKKAEYIIYLLKYVFNLLPFQAWFGIQHQAEIKIIELPIYFQITIAKR